MSNFVHNAVLACLGLWVAGASTALAGVAKVLDIEPVWAGHPVGFCLLTQGRSQYVAYYDAKRQMTVAARKLDSDKWDFVKLPTKVEWDSHNYITMAMDDEGCLHLAGNMHCVPLIYFRMQRPGDIQSIQRIDKMVGHEEDRCTYPIFLRGPGEELIFTYRHGSSGNGDQYYNAYDLKTHAWRRLFDQPLTKAASKGKGHMSAYFSALEKGPDGFYHICWVWRNSGACETNHDLCYARSKDLVHWQNSAGKPLTLPITPQQAEVVDPVPPGGGMINGNNHLGFDSANRVLIAYHKFDRNGVTQAYIARREEGGWKVYQVSNWDYRWEFKGGGSIVKEVGIGEPICTDGLILLHWSHEKYGSGVFTLDEQTLKPSTRTPTKPPRKAAPAARTPMHKIVVTGNPNKVESDFPGMQVRWGGDVGKSPDPGASYRLRWEALPPNRDRPREGPLPAPVMLRLYEFRD